LAFASNLARSSGYNSIFFTSASMLPNPKLCGISTLSKVPYKIKNLK
jgi:hypothetical protein